LGAGAPRLVVAAEPPAGAAGCAVFPSALHNESANEESPDAFAAAENPNIAIKGEELSGWTEMGAVGIFYFARRVQSISDAKAMQYRCRFAN
jgi:hypothetical protein